MRADYFDDLFHSLSPKCCLSFSVSDFIFLIFGCGGIPRMRYVMFRSIGDGVYWLFLCGGGTGPVSSLGGPFYESSYLTIVKVWERDL